MIDEELFGGRRGGVFVDVGAHDGVSFNNTVYFEHSLGWQGLCVEPIASQTARIFPDDNAMRGAMAQVDFGYPAEGLRQAVTLGRGALGRTRALLKGLVGKI